MPLSITSQSLTACESGSGNAAVAQLPVTTNAIPRKDSEALGNELNQLRTQIKRESDAYQHHMLRAAYEDVRPRPLSTRQKIKDLWVSVQMAGSGHQPGHTPNRSLQQAWKAKERLARLNNRYIPLAKAEALAQMGEQLMDAEDSLRGLTGDKAAAVSVHVNRLRERFEAAKFAFAIDVGETLAKDTAPLLPLFNVQTYLGLQQAGQGIRDAADGIKGMYNKQCVRPDLLKVKQTQMYHEDALRMAAVDHGTHVVDDLREKHAEAAPADKQWLESFMSQTRQVLSRIDAALSLPGAEGVELEEVRVLLKDMLGQASPPTSGRYATGANGVYCETTGPVEEQGYTPEMQRLGIALGSWLLGNGVLLTQRVGDAIGEHPVLALGVLAAYGGISTFYSNWFLPASPGLEDNERRTHSSDRLPMLDAEVDIALEQALPDHPDVLIGQVLLDQLYTVKSRAPRSVDDGNLSVARTGSVDAMLKHRAHGENQTNGELVRTAGGIGAEVDDTMLAGAITTGLQRFELQQTELQATYKKKLANSLEANIKDSVDWMTNLYAPILDPSTALDEIINQRIKAFERQTGETLSLQPDSRITVWYKDNQPANPNHHLVSAVERKKYFTLKQVVTGIHLSDISLMRGHHGQVYKVSRVSHQQLVDFIDKKLLKRTLEANLSDYKARPGLEQKWVDFYDGRIKNAAFNYLSNTSIEHPGHVLMSRFLNGELKASEVEFHGTKVSGVFAVTHGQSAVMCSVDDDNCFYISEKRNTYWKFGASYTEFMPVYPNDEKFNSWIRIKLPIIEQVKAARNPQAFEVTRTKMSTNVQIGMGRNGGRVKIKPLTFTAQESPQQLSASLFKSNMARAKSDIDTLIFTDWEHFSLEALNALNEILKVQGLLLMVGAPGTGAVLKSMIYATGLGLASAGAHALKAEISDDPTERDTAEKSAWVSLISTAVSLGIPLAIGGAKGAYTVASAVHYHRFAKEYIIRPDTFRIIKDVLARRYGIKFSPAASSSHAPANTAALLPKTAGSSPATGQAVASGAVPGVQGVAGKSTTWNQMTDAQKVSHLSNKLTASGIGKKLIARTSEQSVRQSIANNRRQALTTATNWKSERTEINLAKALLESDSKRVDTVDQFIKQLHKQPPTIETRAVSGPPVQRAAGWIAASSSPWIPEGRLQQVIAQFQQADLSKISVIDDIHRAIIGTSEETVRLSGDAGQLGSDIAHGAFVHQLKNSGAPTGLSRAEWLFGLTQSFQPYATNNDPLARTLYALAHLQDTDNGFSALVKTSESRLSPPSISVKKPPARVPAAPTSAPDVDTRIEPFRQIEGNPSRALPVEMHGFMETLRANPKLHNAFMAPAGQCASAAETVAEFMRTNGFENIRFRGMLIWSSRNPDGVFNHFLPVGDFQGKTYAFDLTAPQFANKGMPSLTDPMILPEPALMQAYQAATNKALIKYKDFSNLRSAEAAFSDFSAPGPKQFIEGGHLLSYGWSKPTLAQPNAASGPSPLDKVSTPVRGIARVRAQDTANRKPGLQVPLSSPAPAPLAIDNPGFQLLGPKNWGSLSDKDKIDYLVNRLLLSDDARALMGSTDKATVVQSIRNNLTLDGLGVPRQRFAWGALQSEVGHGLRRLAQDRARLEATNAAVRSLLDSTPVVPRELKLGNPYEKAAEWIVDTSRSDGLTADEVLGVLWRNRDVDLTDIHTIDEIHAQVYKPGPGEPYRDFRSSSDPVYMASEIGHAGFVKLLPELAQSAQDGKWLLADGLFAAAVRFHPYGDGNGRLARALYALAQIKADGPFFKALTPEGESILNPRI